MIVKRWPGKPTSGRYVYRLRDGGWWWQCDLGCGDEHWADDQSVDVLPTMQLAFAGALAHALVCGQTNGHQINNK